MICRYTEAEHAIFRTQLEVLAFQRGIELIFLPGSRRADGSWLPAQSHCGELAGLTDSDALLRLVPDIANRDVFVCGPVPWIAAVRKAAKGARVRKDDFHYEDYAW